MKRKEILEATVVLNEMLREKLTVSTAIAISDCLAKLEPYRKSHDKVVEDRLKGIEGFEDYRNKRQAIISSAQSNPASRGTAQRELISLDLANTEVVEQIKNLDGELSPALEEEIEIELPKIVLADDMVIDGMRVYALKKLGIL